MVLEVYFNLLCFQVKYLVTITAEITSTLNLSKTSDHLQEKLTLILSKPIMMNQVIVKVCKNYS